MVSNYILDLVRRGAGLALDEAPKPALAPDFGPSLSPLDVIARESGTLIADQVSPEAPPSRAPAQREEVPPERTPSELVTELGARAGEETQATSSTLIETLQIPPHTPAAMELPPARESRPVGNITPMNASGEESVRSTPGAPLAETTVSRSQPAGGGLPNGASSAERVPESPSIVAEGPSSDDLGSAGLTLAQEAPSAEAGEVISQPDDTSTMPRRGSRASVVPLKPDSYASGASTPAEQPRPEGPATILPEQSLVSDLRTGVADELGRTRPEIGLPGLLGGPRSPQNGGEPEDPRSRHFSQAHQETAKSAPFVPAPQLMRAQTPYPSPDGDSRHFLDAPDRWETVSGRARDRVVPVAGPSPGPETFRAQKKPAASRQEPQAIQVHIGRVEVRSAAPSPPVPQVPKPQGFEGYELVRNYVSWERH